jgi:glyoxylase-like metal-dependent hydrolase (beta-lactamase superfamily II)
LDLAPIEQLPGLWRLPLPLRGSPLGFVNTYLVRGDAGYTLVDCGWDTADCFAVLEGQLRALGVAVADLRTLVVTHIHPDHYGLAGRLKRLSGAGLVLHRLERVYLESRYADVHGLLEEMAEWLRANGAPQSEVDLLRRSGLALLDRVTLALPDRTVEGGERLDAGPYDFELLWTPGHSAGHICLYERRRKLLLSGDHVLPRISPNISLHAQGLGNPLADYLDALRLVAELEVELVLPGHGDPFVGLAERAAELAAHHERRLAEIARLLAERPWTAYEVAARTTWQGSNGVWDRLSDFQRRIAVTETLAHLELLRARGQARKLFQGGVVRFAAPQFGPED